MYKVFIVEDDKGITEGITTQLKAYDLEVHSCTDFHDVMSDFKRIAPHIVLMDISLPFFDGYHWTSKIREISKVPIIFISSASENMNIVMAMNIGADEFVTKPFDMSVLVAKTRALLRRTYDFSVSAQIIECMGAMLDTDAQELRVNDRKIELSKNEYRILAHLMKNKGKIVSREKLIELIWETDQFIDDNTLTVNINRLRKKLEAAGLKDFIKTKFGVGYIVGNDQ